MAKRQIIVFNRQ